MFRGQLGKQCSNWYKLMSLVHGLSVATVNNTVLILTFMATFPGWLHGPLQVTQYTHYFYHKLLGNHPQHTALQYCFCLHILNGKANQNTTNMKKCYKQLIQTATYSTNNTTSYWYKSSWIVCLLSNAGLIEIYPKTFLCMCIHTHIMPHTLINCSAIFTGDNNPSGMILSIKKH